MINKEEISKYIQIAEQPNHIGWAVPLKDHLHPVPAPHKDPPDAQYNFPAGLPEFSFFLS